MYNLTHPLLEELVSKLESEATTMANTVPFDYRISQLLYESETGTAPTFHNYYQKVDISIAVRGTSNNKDNGEEEEEEEDDDMSHVRSWSTKYDFDVAVQDISVIGNYARTNLVEDMIDDNAYIVHGANMLSEWDTTNMGVRSFQIFFWDCMVIVSFFCLDFCWTETKMSR